MSDKPTCPCCGNDVTQSTKYGHTECKACYFLCPTPDFLKLANKDTRIAELEAQLATLTQERDTWEATARVLAEGNAILAGETADYWLDKAQAKAEGK